MLRLFPTNIFDLLPKDHDCFIYEALLEHIDTSEVEKQYHPLGQHAFHPKLIVAILIYAYSHGVFSSREIERRCNQDLGFMYISQMNCPNFRVLGDFRKNNLKFFHDCFKQSVKLALELKMASLGHISLDGSKFKANTSKHKAMSYGRLKSQESELTTEIDDLIKKANKSDKEIDGYIATDRQEKPVSEALDNSDRTFVKADFVYDDENDVFICPAKETLITNPDSKAKRKSYRADKAICKECPFRSRCSGSKKVAGEFSLVCSAHNFKKIAKSISTESIRLEEARRLRMVA